MSLLTQNRYFCKRIAKEKTRHVKCKDLIQGEPNERRYEYEAQRNQCQQIQSCSGRWRIPRTSICLQRLHRNRAKKKKKRQNPTHSVDTPDADSVPNFLFASYAEWKYTRLLILSRTMKIYMNTKKKCLFCIRLMRRGDCLRRKNVSTLMVVDHTMFLLPRYMTFKGLNVASRTRLRARITCFALTHTWSTYCQSYSTQLYLSVRVRLRSDAFLWTQTMFTERVYRFRIKRVSKQIEFKMHIYINTNTYNISNYRCNKTLLLALTISYEN